MRRRHEVMRARNALCKEIKKHVELSDAQLVLFEGMLSALLWVCEDETETNVLKRLLDGERVSGIPREFADFIVARSRSRLDSLSD